MRRLSVYAGVPPDFVCADIKIKFFFKKVLRLSTSLLCKRLNTTCFIQEYNQDLLGTEQHWLNSSLVSVMTFDSYWSYLANPQIC